MHRGMESFVIKELRMRTGKTSSGIGMASTSGMPNRRHHRTWVAVVNRSRACFFERETRNGEVHTIHQITNPQGRVPVKELVSDRPGRSFDSGTHGESGGARHAYSSPVSPHDEAALKLVSKIVDYLEEGRVRNQYEHLILVAEPHFLGVLREAMGSPLSSLVSKEVHMDLTHLSNQELAQDISEILESEPSMGVEERAV